MTLSNFELSIELNQFWTKFKFWIESVWVSDRGGDLLRSVPCVTVWHQKIISQILWVRKNSIKVHLLYVPLITKNILGHLPDLTCKDRNFLYFLTCHTVTFHFLKTSKAHSKVKEHWIYGTKSKLCNYKHVT